MKKGEDGYGQMLLAALDGRDPLEIVERDDSFIEAAGDPRLYLAPFRRWHPLDRRAMRFVGGRTLDVGCGGGRVCLHLQERATGVASSPRRGTSIAPKTLSTRRITGGIALADG